MKKYSDTHRRDLSFEIGDLVFLKLRPYRRKSLASRPFENLTPHFHGSYKVLVRIGEVAYKLQLADHAIIHLVFHITRLKRALGASDVSSDMPPQLTEDLKLCVEPEEMLGVRPGKGNPGHHLEVLVK